MRRIRRLAGLAAVALVSVLLTLGLLEMIGRWVLRPLLVAYVNNRALKLQLANPKDLGIASIYVPHHYYLYETRPSYRSADGEVRHNSLGCRAEEVTVEKPHDVVRLVAVGGSTTYATPVKRNRDVYTYLLEARLNDWASARRLDRRFEVINCGVPGATSAENLGRYIFALSEYRPDVLLVQQGLNDANPRALPHLSRDYREYSKTWDQSDPTKETWFLRRLLRAARNRFGDSIWTQGISFLVRHAIPNGLAPENYDRNGPRIFEANTRYLVRLASGDGASVVLLSEHIVADKSVDWRQLPPGRVRATLEHNEVVARLAASEKVLFFDLQGALCACSERMPDGRHLNEAGEREKAQALFEYLTSSAVARRWLPARRADVTGEGQRSAAGLGFRSTMLK